MLPGFTDHLFARRNAPLPELDIEPMVRYALRGILSFRLRSTWRVDPFAEVL